MVEKDMAYVASQRGVDSLEPNLGKQIICVVVLILLCDLILPFPSFSKLSVLIEQLIARRTIFRTSISSLLVLMLISSEVRVQSL
jgi:uncharacterized protein YhhL (DUF1145 family)